MVTRRVIPEIVRADGAVALQSVPLLWSQDMFDLATMCAETGIGKAELQMMHIQLYAVSAPSKGPATAAIGLITDVFDHLRALNSVRCRFETRRAGQAPMSGERGHFPRVQARLRRLTPVPQRATHGLRRGRRLGREPVDHGGFPQDPCGHVQLAHSRSAIWKKKRASLAVTAVSLSYTTFEKPMWRSFCTSNCTSVSHVMISGSSAK